MKARLHLAANLGLSWCFSALAGAQATTGWNQTAGGTYDYNSTDNWVGGTINGNWDPSLTLSAVQTVTFGADTSLTTGLDFGYGGAQNLTLRSDGSANRTLTLGGNIVVDTVSANRTITIGSTTANQGLNLDLGNAIRTFTVGALTGTDATRSLTLNNNVSNGGLILNGGGIVNSNGNANILTSLRVQNSAFRITGNSGADVSTAISGALTIDGAAKSIASNTTQLGGIATITLTPNSNHNTSLSAASLVRTNSGVVLFRGNNLGGTLGANNVSNITFSTGPGLVGGGGSAGTKNISILPWAIGATTAGGAANTFVTYDSVNGIRPLDTANEFENYAADYSGAVTGTDLNTRIATGTVTFAGNNTVNSLIMGEVGVSTLNGDGGTLTVTSGAVFVNRNSSAISQNLNFGTREGIIGIGQPSSVTISGGISGSGGLTTYQASSHTSEFSNGVSVTFTGAATFTGDFTVNSRAQINHSDFLPRGTRTGNVVVNGLLTLNGLGTGGAGYTMNGLYGDGRLAKGSSGSGLFRIGDNNSNGNFTGIITDGGNTVVQKIGSGTQVFTGANSYNGATHVLGGTLDVTLLADGTFASGIGRTPNAASNLVLNGGTLKYSGVTTSSDRLFTIGTSGGALNASGSGAVNFTATGAYVSAEAASRAGTRTVGSNVVTGVTNFADLVIGARVSGTGITAGTTITAINTTTGEITLSANATADSSANMSFSTDRTFTLGGTNTGDNTISGVIANSSASGKLSVTKSGSGTWILSGNNTYTGATQVDSGKLVINGNISTSPLTTVASGATLGGDGTVGAATISGILAPGNSIGTITATGDVTWNDNDAWVFELGSAASTLALADSGSSIQDMLNITGGGSDFLKGSGSAFTFDFANSGEAGFYKLVDWSGTSDFVAGDFVASNLAPGLTGTFTVDSGTSALYLNVVPEPRAALLGGLGMLVLLRRRRV